MLIRQCLLAVAVVFASATTRAQNNGAPDPKTLALGGGERALMKMSSQLLESRLDVLAGKPARGTLRSRIPYAERKGKTQVIIAADSINDDLVAACKTAGLDIEGTYNLPGGLHHVVVLCDSPTQLDALARRSDVRGIVQEPLKRTSVGDVTSQADSAINAASARTALGINGSGIRVGVLSDSFKDVTGGTLAGGLLTGATNQLTGDLPASVRIIDAGPGGKTDEGSAMAEHIYDLAPGCDISFASAFTSYSSFASNILALYTDPGRKCHVICDDVYYFAEPVYQNGPIAIACNTVVTSGTPYFSAAGNQGNDAHERAFFDVNSGSSSTASNPTGVDFHDFGQAYGTSSKTHLAVSLPTNAVVTAFMSWDEPGNGTYSAGGGATSDLDLYLVSNTSTPITSGNKLAQSISQQGTVGSPFGSPYEAVQYQNTGSSATVYLVIDHYTGRTPVNLWLGIDVSGTGSSIVDKSLVQDRTIVGHAATQNAIAVGAMYYREKVNNGNFYLPNTQLDVESYSSKGGTLPYWISDNGLTRYGTAQNVTKPEMTAPDGCDNTFFPNIAQDTDGSGYPNFFGTSAAAPHAAAVAALILSRTPSLTPAQVYSRMTSTATDSETAGWDNLSGYGLINALTAVPVQMSSFSVE
ncbi:MAG: S8 family serine peptidase [Candidatus Sumerlaeaceae bacterium]|nr:S8 family serine peptidase [Candidatus Sumerlaeaceae bacterium]